MPPHRKGTKVIVKEEEIQEILRRVKSGKYTSCYAAAKVTGVNRTLLEQRLNSTHQSQSFAHELEQQLTPKEERALVQWCQQLTVAGYPARHSILQEMAKEISNCQTAFVNAKNKVLV